jgi:hypothetical protein
MSCVPMDEDHEVTEEAVKDKLVSVREQTLRPIIHPSYTLNRALVEL